VGLGFGAGAGAGAGVGLGFGAGAGAGVGEAAFFAQAAAKGIAATTNANNTIHTNIHLLFIL